MKINWKVRLLNKTFWLTIIPATLLTIQLILAIFGITFNVDELTGKIIAVVDAIFAILMMLGIAVDPTTKGISDSEQAMTYTKPKEDNKE